MNTLDSPFAPSPPPLYAQDWKALRPRPDAVFQVGSLEIEYRAGHGAALIFIPGMAAGAWAWDEIAPRFAPAHRVYAVTMPGFDGRAAPAGPLIERVSNDLKSLVQEENLLRPILVGHSSGAFTAFHVAMAHPDSFGGIVAVDGFPVFATAAEAPRQQRAGMADKVATLLGRNEDAVAFGSAMRNFILARTTQPAKGGQLAELAASSCPAATESYVLETLPQGLRPGLAGLRMPVLVLAAVHSYKQDLPEQEMLAFYERMMAGATRCEVRLIADSCHFAMLDQPDLVRDAIADFLRQVERQAIAPRSL
ncbi:hypothetical protein N234_25650 [Ralstonia pickettii DTP0602]|nr:hypothetical protein N234_25650 [Ralstonia pickettii DTP0602]